MTRNEFAWSTPPTSNHDQIMNMDGRGRPTCHPSYRRTSACSAPATWRPTNICLWKVVFGFSLSSCSITPLLGLILSTSSLYSLCWLNSIHDIFEAVDFNLHLSPSYVTTEHCFEKIPAVFDTLHQMPPPSNIKNSLKVTPKREPQVGLCFRQNIGVLSSPFPPSWFLTKIRLCQHYKDHIRESSSMWATHLCTDTSSRPMYLTSYAKSESCVTHHRTHTHFAIGAVL